MLRINIIGRGGTVLINFSSIWPAENLSFRPQKMGYSIINKYQCGVELEEDTPEALAEQIILFHDMSLKEREKIGENARIGAKDFDFGILTGKLIEAIESATDEKH